ncbi:MAG: glycine zipper 2TM domain-containing protein [Gammaproteobacteria bacterium]|nr:glycine zipper 2TM domain-containing protein [Gammaproteobacteria bacterium]
MNKTMISVLVVSGVAVIGGVAIANYQVQSDPEVQQAQAPTHAEVIRVADITHTEQVPREVCRDVEVTRQKPVQDEHRITGSVAGAIVGGVLGNQVGGGSGKKLATIAGAAAGGYAGNKTQERIQQSNTYTTLETRCEMQYESRQRHDGYQVDYRIGEETGSVRMQHHPGDRIPLNNGELVLSQQ